MSEHEDVLTTIGVIDGLRTRIAELEQSETELQDACDKQFKATVRQRERAEKAEAAMNKYKDELAALKARRCETCKDSSQTEHGDFCCEIGLEMVDYEPFPDGFSCSEWETRP